MQRLYFTIILLFFLFVSCSKQKPKGILSEKDMTELMTEVSLIDAYLNTLPIDSGRKVMPVLYERAFEKFKLDSTLFIHNLDYYLGNPILTEKIYTDVNTTLSKQDRMYQQEDSIRNAVVQDSIQQAMRLQRYTAMLKDMISNVHRDSTAYTYVQNGTDFLTKAELQLNAYGIQVPVITPPPPAETESDTEERVDKESSDTTKSFEKLDTTKIKKVLRKPAN
ncbi:DUF4296 domain-containing protein [Sphingobacterium paucimobilis]|uniref:DUF4296 domain-containing protein n=1 Tax=Sphingobacterium paucimobilis HER1398 TaxID=1346330 RepID=U2H6B0_9SPHI|nr:DUF4296 domain-containing protein [Sphingobacterium paucimobilis]ERJ57241.1 hypothetical protein M472_00530 [Sphingobacterium paucimobilis HER1398]